jgi:hypothetical protein
MKFTGQRQDAYEFILGGRRSRAISAEEFRSLKADIVSRETKYQAGLKKRRDKREADRKAEEAKRVAEALRLAEQKEKERKAKRASEAKARRGVLKEMKRIKAIVNEVYDGGEDAFVVPIWRRLPNAPMRLLIVRDGIVVVDKELMYSPKYKDVFRKEFMASYNNWLIESGDRIIIVGATTLSAKRIAQVFRDGVAHCVFEPIKAKLIASIESSKSKETKIRNTQRLAKMVAYEKQYSKGVPVSNMEEVAKASGYEIMIRNLFKKEVFVFNKGGHSGRIAFLNLRENHLDLDNYVSDDMPTNVSASEMKVLYDEAYDLWISEKKFFHFDFIENGIPKKLYTFKGCYVLRDEDYLIMEDFNKSIVMKNYRFNATKYPEVNEFIKQGRIINSWPTTIGSSEPTGHIDMPKAYSQFKKCAWYNGFMGVIHQWRVGAFDKAFMAEHIGIYRAEVFTEDPLLVALGVGGLMTLPSVELTYLMDIGCSVSVVAGCWGSKFDFEFSDEMLSKRRYCTWAGRLGMEYKKKSYSFYSTPEWASHLKADYGEDVRYFQNDGVCNVKIAKDSLYTTHHILAFITSYTRINMLQAMRKFPVENLCRVVMDGIYYSGSKPADLEWFVEKPMKTASFTDTWYKFESVDISKWTSASIVKNTLLTGQGGAGKTHSVMTAGGYNDILFVTPQHLLGVDVHIKYGIGYTTINKLLGKDCIPLKDERPAPPVIFADEITQLHSDWVSDIFTMYPSSLIILAGDLSASGQWFQCRGGTPGEYSTMWKPTGVDVVLIDGDRRSRDDEMKQLKLDVRAEMTKVFVDGDSGEEFMMRKWAMKNLPITDFFSAVQMFSSGDTWIAGTHKTNEALLALGITSGYYKPGGFVSDVEKDGFKKRGSFTIHAYQGKTVESGKIFISITDAFEYSMLYTAISRAVHRDQLVFVA